MIPLRNSEGLEAPLSIQLFKHFPESRAPFFFFFEHHRLAPCFLLISHLVSISACGFFGYIFPIHCIGEADRVDLGGIPR